MLRTTLSVCIYFLMATFLSTTLIGQVIYDNGAGGIKGIDSGFISDQDSSSFGTDDFELTGSHVLKQIEWSGYYGTVATEPADDDFVIDIYLSDRTTPSKLVRRNFIGDDLKRIDSGASVDGFSVFSYTAKIEDFDMSEYSGYWLDIHNNSLSSKNSWHWGVVSDGGNSLYTEDLGQTWQKGGHLLDFRLSGVSAVPEPSGIMVGALILGSFVMRRRR